MRTKTETYRKHPGIASVIFFSLNDYRTQMGEENKGRYRQRVHGTTDLYGNPKPSYQVLKETAAPVVIEGVRLEGTNRVVCNLRVRDDIPCYTVSGYRLVVWEKEKEAPKADIEFPTTVPGQTRELAVEGDFSHTRELAFRIVRPTGFVVCEMCIFKS